VDFEKGNMLFLEFSKDRTTWSMKEAPLPFLSYQINALAITDDNLVVALKEAPRGKGVLEADVLVMGITVRDRQYDRPANPVMSLLGDEKTGMVIGYRMSEPEEDPMLNLAEMVIEYIFRYGAPKEIRVSNVLVEAVLDQICEVCGIRLKRMKHLPGLDEFVRGMDDFM